MRLLKAKGKKERALGMNLGLKAHRSNSPKSPLVRRGSRPGVHGSKFQRNISEYKLQLMEKQKIKFSYGLNEKQMSRVVKNAISDKKSTAEEITKNLERRLDNVVFRIGIAGSRSMGRQIVTHGHIYINGRRFNIPSYKVNKGDKISIKESSKKSVLFKDLHNILKSKNVENWLLFNPSTLECTVKEIPDNVETPFNINLVIDYYSR